MTLAELRDLVALCRKAGVKEVKVGDVSLVMGEPPPKLPRGRAARKADALAIGAESPEDYERMIFYSAGGPLGEN